MSACWCFLSDRCRGLLITANVRVSRQLCTHLSPYCAGPMGLHTRTDRHKRCSDEQPRGVKTLVALVCASLLAVVAAPAPSAQANASNSAWVSLSATSNGWGGTTLIALAGADGYPAANTTIYLHWRGDDTAEWGYYSSAVADSGGHAQFDVGTTSGWFRAVIVDDAGEYWGVSYDVWAGGPEPTPAAPAPEPAPPAVSNSVVDIAAAQVGIGYAFGGESPAEGFDCSGLVKYVYSQVGVALPHGANALASYGAAVAQQDAQPGDVLLFGSPGAYYHAAIYAGGGAMWHAPGDGRGVVYQTLWSNNYIALRLI